MAYSADVFGQFDQAGALVGFQLNDKAGTVQSVAPGPVVLAATPLAAVVNRMALQAAVAAAIAAGGSTVTMAAGRFYIDQAITIPAQMVLRGTGVPGIGELTGSGSTVIIGPAGGAAFNVGPTSGILQSGARLEDLYVCSADGTGRAFDITRMSNVSFVRCTAYGYTTAGSFGWNWVGQQDGEQYADMIDCRCILTRNCVNVSVYNGITIRGGFYQNYDSNALSIQAGSWFLKCDSTTDTVIVTGGARVQFFEKGVILSGEAHKVNSTRFEGCTTGIEVTGGFCQVGQDCSFNNYITGGTGLAIDIKASAAFTVVGTYTHQSMTLVPVRDAGNNTTRNDARKIRVQLDGISASKTIVAEVADRPWMVGRARMYSGVNFTTVYNDRWTINVPARGYVESYSSGWPAGGVYDLWGGATEGTGTPINAGSPLVISLSKSGAGVTINGTYLEIELVPY